MRFSAQLLIALTLMFCLTGYGTDASLTKKTPKKTKTNRTQSTIASVTVVNTVIPAAKSNPAPIVPTVEDAPRRTIDFRFHPLYLAQMLTDHETLAAGRVDLDFLAGEKFSFGPSFIYNHNLVFGAQNSLIDQTTMEFGLLLNEHLTGTTSTGGLVLREHAYLVDPDANRTDANGGRTSSTAVSLGMRAGAELLYQTILKCGLSFEFGGGFTYHVVPYSIQYSDGSQIGPAAPVAPTLTVGIGWAF
jgi:hypothetical protein